MSETSFGKFSPMEKRDGEADLTPDQAELATRAIMADKVISETAAALSLTEKTTPDQLEADKKRVTSLLDNLWGAGGKISLYEESFSSDRRMEEILPEIENYITALEDAVDSGVEFDGKTVLETLINLTKKRDHIKIALLKQ